MKKLCKSIHKEYPASKLYKEDLISLFELLEEEDFNIETVTTENFEYSKKEFLELDNQIVNSLKINFNKPFYLSVEFYNGNIKIYIGSDGTTELGIIYKIDQFLKGKSRNFINTISQPLVSLFISIATFLIIFGTLYWLTKNGTIDKTNFIHYLYLILPSIFIISWIPFSVLAIRRPQNIIILDRKKNHPGFWKKNKEEIIKDIIILIIGAIVGHFIQ